MTMSDSGASGSHLFAEPSSPGSHSIARAEMLYRLRWFVRLRWIAAAAVIALPLFISEGVGVDLPLLRLSLVGIIIAGYNLLFRVWLQLAEDKMTDRLGAVIANLQIVADLVTLTVVLHFSGGVENPLVAYYVFHVIIAATMLSMPAAYAQATLAIALFAAMTAGEASGILHHWHILGLSQEGVYNTYFAWLVVAAVASTLYVTAFLSVAIAERLRQREYQLERLGQETGVRAAQCQLAYDRLVELQRGQIQYMRRVTHELKGPLAAIVTSLAVIMEHYAGDVDETQARLLERVYKRAQDALDMLGDLLDLARMRELPTERFQPVEMNRLIESVVEGHADQAIARGLELRVESSGRLPAINGDREALETMLANLVSNAIKYTKAGGQVTLGTASEAGHAVIRVTDNGPGIPQEDLPRIFDDFYRSPEARKRDIDGTGLGLAIVKSIVDRHGGTIDVASKPGEGATFTIRLPVVLTDGSAPPV
jgi:signal transduction histidine kinase